VKTVRWLLVLPCAVAAWIIVPIVVAIIWDLSPWQGPKDAWRQILQTGIGAASFVLVGAKLAPCRKFATSLVLAGVHAMVTVGLCLIVVEHGGSKWWWAVLLLVALFTSVAACGSVYQKEAEPIPSRDPTRQSIAF
jgi:MFS family permease